MIAAIALQLRGVAHVFANDPDSFSPVRSSGLFSRNNSPFRVIPQRGKISRDDVKPSSSESWGIFQEDVCGSNFANDSSHFTPQSGFFPIFDAGSAPCHADVLTGKPARYNVNNSSPRLSVKGANVIPNREMREYSVVLPCDKYACCVFVDFNGADGAPPKQVSAEDSAACSGEQGELAHLSIIA
jgi:hypothetical protein